MPEIEIIARALIREKDRVFLAHQYGESNTFLPGGHVETGEYIVDALRRELSEELGVESEIGAFAGVLEHKFTDNQGKSYEEINFIFEAYIREPNVSSVEGHLEFKWVNPEEFEEEYLLPSSLQRLIPDWIKNRTPFHHDQRD